MRKYSIQLSWSDEDEVWVASSPEFDGVTAFGESWEEAVDEMRVALELAEETYRDERWSLPEAQRVIDHSGQLRVRMPRNLHGRLSRQAKMNGVSLNQLIVSYLAEKAGGVAAERAVAREFRSLLEGLRSALVKLEEGIDYRQHATYWAESSFAHSVVYTSTATDVDPTRSPFFDLLHGKQAGSEGYPWDILISEEQGKGPRNAIILSPKER